MTAPAIPPSLPESPFPRAPTPAQAVEAVLGKPGAAFHVGHRPLPKRRTYSWFRKAAFITAPFFLKAPKYGAVLTVVGLTSGAVLGTAMGHVSTDPGWNMQSGFAMGAMGVGMLMGPTLAVGQLLGLLEGVKRLNARRAPGGLDGLIEQLDMRRQSKSIEAKQQKLNQQAMRQEAKAGRRGPGL